MVMQQERLGAAGDPASPPKRWMVVNTHRHREDFAIENLERQAFEAYCPKLRKRRSHARRIDFVLRPLFPSYLFVRGGERWQAIQSTLGVRTIVWAGEKPGCIDDGFIAGLKEREVEGAIVRPPSPYRVGQEVRISTGPFDGTVAEIIAMDEKDRLVVLIDMLNRSTRLTLKSDMVAPV
jgi:transcriptional antiterminator RfaH